MSKTMTERMEKERQQREACSPFRKHNNPTDKGQAEDLRKVTQQCDELLADLALAQQMVTIESKRANEAERLLRDLVECPDYRNINTLQMRAARAAIALAEGRQS